MARLEQIAQMYGMTDYYDQHTGTIYQLSNAVEACDGTEQLLVPAVDITTNQVIGYARMDAVEV